MLLMAPNNRRGDRVLQTFYNSQAHLMPLGETEWPEAVKKQIDYFFREIGIGDLMRQKLVEHYAFALGGVKDMSGDGRFERVNWERVVDYFKWEAQSLSEEMESDETHLTTKEMQLQAYKIWFKINSQHRLCRPGSHETAAPRHVDSLKPFPRELTVTHKPLPRKP
jgi:hypothetical protein